MLTWLILILLAVIALALGGLKVLLTFFIVVAFIAIVVGAVIVGGFHNLADRGDELNERNKGKQSKG